MLASLIDGIVAQSRSRRLQARPTFSCLQRPRDIRETSREARSRGLIPVIAEIKARVLSRPLQVGEAGARARKYEEMGACAVSVITEPSYFLGSLDSVPEARDATSLPVLRKDFLLEERQLQEVETDLILLIASILPNLVSMVEAARSLGVEPLVEVHTREDLDRALGSGADLVGINNRDLQTLDVDLNMFLELGPLARDAGVFVVAESGIKTREDALLMMHHGADALLVGTVLMQEPQRLAVINGLEELKL